MAKRPGATLAPDDTRLADARLPDPEEGHFRVAISHLTLDVSMIGWMREGRSYLPAIALGDPLRATAVGRVEDSRHPGFDTGDLVTGLFAAASHVTSDGAGVLKLDGAVAPAAAWAGSLGLTTAVTSFVGMGFAGSDLDGKTVLVSGVSGLVGGFAAQFARARGGRVVGIAGGQKACREAVDRMGLAACIDYRDDRPMAEALRETCPDRIDVFYDNAGGGIFDAALGWMNAFGTVVMCGQTAERGLAKPPPVTAIRTVIMERLTIRGFVVFDHPERFDAAAEAIGDGIATGRLQPPHEDILHSGGLEAFHGAYHALVTGQRKGKHVLCL